MSKRIASLSASTLSIAILACAAPARAVDKEQAFFENPGSACQLSIPTIDTVVAPRANGYRNPGTQGAFVICGFPYFNKDFKGAGVVLMSLDGAQHTITCTAVNGVPLVAEQTYVSKAVVVPAGGSEEILYTPEDFGTIGTIDNTLSFSITCNLPPQTAITVIGSSYDLDVGA
jgi:hypothetical protein